MIKYGEMMRELGEDDASKTIALGAAESPMPDTEALGFVRYRVTVYPFGDIGASVVAYGSCDTLEIWSKDRRSGRVRNIRLTANYVAVDNVVLPDWTTDSSDSA